MISVRKSSKVVKSTVPLTSSKSITNRALIIQALCDEKIVIENSANADDSKVLKSVLENLTPAINVNDAGTAFRFLTAFLAIQPGTFILTGTERMKQRPIGGLVKALQSISAEIEFMEVENFPPLRINGKNLSGGYINIDASESSQFISALLLIAPKLSKGLKLEVTGKINSDSYIEMTISVMNYFGVEVKRNGNVFEIASQNYSPEILKVENDWSSASFWYEIAALSDEAHILLKGLSKNSIQGDLAIDDIMKIFGVQSEQTGEDIIITKNSDFIKPEFFEYDFSSFPDLVIPIATVCASLKISSLFKGVKNLRIKESDRLHALKNELAKIGGNLLIENDSFLIKPSADSGSDKMFSSYTDHRIIMALAPLALKYGQVNLDDHLPVRKSYPEFWDQLRNAGFSCEVI